MADAITIKALQDASLDAKSLEEVVNGDEVKQVTTRLGETYPSVKKAIKTMFDNGGLPAVPFATKALMTASALVNGDYAQVTDDTVNNGLYVKTAGAWVKSEYDPLTQAKADATNKADAALADGKIYTDSSIKDDVLRFVNSNKILKDMLAILDVNDTPVFRVDENGEVYYVGSSQSLQTVLAELKQQLSPIASAPFFDDLFMWVDSNNIPAMRIAENGDLMIKGVDSSVQDKLSQIGEATEVIPYTKKSQYLAPRYNLNAPFLNRLNNARAMNRDVAPVPYFATQQDFNVGTAWINNVTLAVQNPADRVIMSGYDPTFNEDIGVVHPQIWSFNESLAGYKHWLSINPYTNTNEAIEIPFIYGTNDASFRSWELIPTFPQPFEEDPLVEDGSIRGFLSDPGFVYDPKTGDLVYFWRKYLKYAVGTIPLDKIAIRASRFNGKVWSNTYDLHDMKEPVGGTMTSLNIVYNPTDDLFYMYYIDAGKLWYKTSPDITSDNWSARTACVVDFNNGKFWHFDMKVIGNKLVVLLQADVNMSSGVSDSAYYFGVSSDFVSFNVSQQSIITSATPRVYKPTFNPIFITDDTVKFRVTYTSDANTTPKWQMFVTDTNTINIGV